jgi:predicted nucleic acid-binding protein
MRPVSSSPAGLANDWLVDTNVLLRSVEAGHPMQAIARQALQSLTAGGATLCISPQNIIEFWAAATRPVAANGLGLSPAQAAAEVVNFKAAFRFLLDAPAIFTHWERIVTTYGVHGKQANDARLVAVMKAHAVEKILTFNQGDFSPYASGESITVVCPAIAATLSP